MSCDCKRLHSQHDPDCELYAPDPPMDTLLGVPPQLCAYRGNGCPDHQHARTASCPQP